VIGPLWTAARRQLLIDSRVKSTQAVLDWCATRAQPPRVLVSASAIGFYGPAGDEWLTEDSQAGEVFQSRLCVEREASADAAQAQGIRAVHLRIGLVLGHDGGIFPRLALAARLGLAAAIGNGRQWMSWIHITDLIRVIALVMDAPRWRGAVNAVAPAPERQRDFQSALAAAVRKPFFLRIPGALLRVALGEMAQLLVDGQRVAPRRLLQDGFDFRHCNLDSAMRALLPDPVGAPSLRSANRDCEVWFNGDCPVCSHEMTGYARLANRRELPLRFHDSMRVAQPLAAYGLRRDHLERRLYLRDEQGRVVSGFSAVLALWTRLPEYRRLARIFGWPPLRALSETVYDHIVAPALSAWARSRRS
jgi:uncharacterized protein